MKLLQKFLVDFFSLPHVVLAEYAKALGVTEREIRGWINHGDTPSSDVLVLLSDHLIESSCDELTPITLDILCNWSRMLSLPLEETLKYPKEKYGKNLKEYMFLPMKEEIMDMLEELPTETKCDFIRSFYQHLKSAINKNKSTNE